MIRSRDRRGLEPGMDAELGQDALDIAAQGADGDIHFTGHLPGALPGDNAFQHLGFTRRERP